MAIRQPLSDAIRYRIGELLADASHARRNGNTPNAWQQLEDAVVALIRFVAWILVAFVARSVSTGGPPATAEFVQADCAPQRDRSSGGQGGSLFSH